MINGKKIIIKILEKLNPDNFSAIVFENKTHMVFDKKFNLQKKLLNILII